MRTVHKYEFPIADSFSISMPVFAEVLHVEEQYGKPCMWVKVETDYDFELRKFELRGTGRDLRESVDDYIATFFSKDGELEWHLFDHKDKVA